MGVKYIIDIKKIAFTKLRKLEVLTFYDDIVRVINRHDTKVMRVDTTCHVLLGMQAKAQLLKLSDRDLGHNYLTPEVSKLHERRLKFAGFITNHMEVVEQAGFKGTDHLVKITKPVVVRYLHYLRQNNRVEVTQTIIQFFKELEEKPEVKDALYELGFKPFLDELQDTHDAYEKTYAERRAYRSSRHKGSTLPVQREIQRILKILFEQVDHYQHVFSDVDYSIFIAQLNRVITEYSKQIKTRDTQRKNKKLKAQEREENALEDKAKMNEIEKTQSDTADTAPATLPYTEMKEDQNETPPASLDKVKGNEKPINGLMDILKKQNEGTKEDDEEK